VATGGSLRRSTLTMPAEYPRNGSRGSANKDRPSQAEPRTAVLERAPGPTVGASSGPTVRTDRAEAGPPPGSALRAHHRHTEGTHMEPYGAVTGVLLQRQNSLLIGTFMPRAR
jgi:hypothetical protein